MSILRQGRLEDVNFGVSQVLRLGKILAGLATHAVEQAQCCKYCLSVAAYALPNQDNRMSSEAGRGR